MLPIRSVSRKYRKDKDTNYMLDHLSSLDIDFDTSYERLTGIICTIGPSSKNVSTLIEMIKSGMNIARLNFSHGSHEFHQELVDNVREAVKIAGDDIGQEFLPVAIALDTKGPEIRTGILEQDTEVDLIKNQIIRITTNEQYRYKGSAIIIYVDYKNIVNVLDIGSQIFIDDGLILLKVIGKGSDYLDCQIQNGGTLGSSKGVNLPGANVDLPALSEKDQNDLIFGIKNNVDIIFASFIRKADDLKVIRKFLADHNGSQIKIISKVENYEGIKNIDEIIHLSDGIMVARGDLGIEIPPEQVLLAQKMIIAKCNIAGKSVICATHMLESMIKKPRPTRAEVSDVANAVLDGSDCVMLSGETAKGEYPIESVRMMDRICLEAEAAIHSRNAFHELDYMTPAPTNSTTATAIAAVCASMKVEAAAIIVVTKTGQSAHQVAKFRPRCPIISVSRNQQVTRQAHLFRGLLPIVYSKARMPDWPSDMDSRINFGIEFGRKRGFIKPGDSVVLITGWREGSGYTNTMRIMTNLP